MTTPEISKICSRISMARTAKQMSQAELAELSDVPQSQISKFENQTIEDPSLANIIKIAETLGLSLNDLTDENMNNYLEYLVKAKDGSENSSSFKELVLNDSLLQGNDIGDIILKVNHLVNGSKLESANKLYFREGLLALSEANLALRKSVKDSYCRFNNLIDFFTDDEFRALVVECSENRIIKDKYDPDIGSYNQPKDPSKKVEGLLVFIQDLILSDVKLEEHFRDEDRDLKENLKKTILAKQVIRDELAETPLRNVFPDDFEIDPWDYPEKPKDNEAEHEEEEIADLDYYEKIRDEMEEESQLISEDALHNNIKEALLRRVQNLDTLTHNRHSWINVSAYDSGHLRIASALANKFRVSDTPVLVIDGADGSFAKRFNEGIAGNENYKGHRIGPAQICIEPALIDLCKKAGGQLSQRSAIYFDCLINIGSDLSSVGYEGIYKALINAAIEPEAFSALLQALAEAGTRKGILANYAKIQYNASFRERSATGVALIDLLSLLDPEMDSEEITLSQLRVPSLSAFWSDGAYTKDHVTAAGFRGQMVVASAYANVKKPGFIVATNPEEVFAELNKETVKNGSFTLVGLSKQGNLGTNRLAIKDLFSIELPW